MLPAFFVCFFLLLILRDETIGTDLSAYERYFLLARYGKSMSVSDPSLYQEFFVEYAGYAGKNFTELFDLTRDPLYWILTWVVKILFPVMAKLKMESLLLIKQVINLLLFQS